MDNYWNPLEDDYNNFEFNSYSRGPGRGLAGPRYTRDGQRKVKLYVRGIPNELTETGIRNLFSRFGRVERVEKKHPTRDTGDTIGFVTMGSMREATEAMRGLTDFQIDRFTMKVTLALSKEELMKRKEAQEQNLLAFDLGSDEEFDNREEWQVTKHQNGMNGFGGFSEIPVNPSLGRGTSLQSSKPKALLATPPSGRIVSNSGDPSRRPIPQGGMGKPGGLQIQVGFDNGVTPKGRGVGRGTQDNTERRTKNFSGKGRGVNIRKRGQDYREHSMGRGLMDQYAGVPYPGMYGAVPMYTYPAYPSPMFMGGMMPQAMAGTHLLQPAIQTPYPMEQPTPAISTKSPKPKSSGKSDKEQPIAQECSVCSTLGSNVCSRCKTPYCSEACQRKDWPEHKKFCKSIAQEMDMTKAFESQFDVTVGDEMIPQVKQLMEKAHGEIEVTKKQDSRAKYKDGSFSSHSSQCSDMEQSDREGRDKSAKNRRNRGKEKEYNNQRKGGNEKEGRCIKKEDKNSRNEDRNFRSEDKISRIDKGNQGGAKKDTGGNKCFNCGDPSHIRSNCPKPANYKMECYNCHEIGHASKDCPLKSDTTCFNCQGIGHISKDCPNKMENMDQSPVPGSSRVGASESAKTTKKSSPKPLSSSTPKEVTPPKSRIAAKIPPKKSLEAASLTLNEEVRVMVTHAVDPGEVWVQVIHRDNIEPLTVIMQRMTEKYGGDSPADVQSVMVGEFYAALYSVDQVWYRVKVLKVNNTNITVQFVDFGNRETTNISNLRQLEPSMLNHPTQAIWCSLDKICPTQGTMWNIPPDRFTAIITPDSRPYKLICKRIIDGQADKLHLVTMTTEEGVDVGEQLIQAGYADQSGQAGALSPAGSVMMVSDLGTTDLAVGEEIPVVITDYTALPCFYIQVPRQENIETFLKFYQEFNTLYMKDNTTSYKPQQVGELVVSLYSKDEGWYRSEVLEISDTTAKLRFIDYGNIETVNLSSMRKAKPICSKLPIQGIACYMYGVEEPRDGVWAKEILEVLEKHTMIPLIGIIKEKNGGVIGLNLCTAEGESVNEFTIKMLTKAENLSAAESKPVVVNMNDKSEDEELAEEVSGPSVIPGCELPVDGTRVVVAISHITSFSEIYVQHGDDEIQIRLASLILDLTKTNIKPNVDFVPQPGSYVAALFGEESDAMLYRGQVTEVVDQDKYMVYFMDYGNSDIVEKKAILPLDKNFFSLPAMAIRCEMKGCGGLPAEAVDQFKEIQSNVSEVKALRREGDIFVVELFQRGLNVNEAFRDAYEVVEEKPMNDDSARAVEPQKASSRVEPLTIVTTELPAGGGRVIGSVVFIESLTSFYIHLSDETKMMELLTLMKELNEHCKQDKTAYSPKVGEYVAALFHCEDVSLDWYRAMVLDVVGDKFKVLFIDYGNSDLISEVDIRQLDRKFAAFPLFAVHCKLQGATDNVELLKDFSCMLNQQAFVEVVGMEDTCYVVRMYLQNDENVCVNTVLGLDGATQEVVTSDNVAVSKSEEPASSDLQEDHHQTEVKVIAGEAAARILPSRLPIGETVSGAPVVIDSLHSFYIQRLDADLQSSLNNMLLEMLKQYAEGGSEYEPSQGEHVAVQYTEDGSPLWYRALVLAVTDQGFNVQFIDYGNCTIVKSDVIRKLDDSYKDLSEMCVHCKLSGNVTETEQGLKLFRQLALNMEMRVRCVSVDNGVYEVDLVNLQGENMADLVVAAEATEPPSTELVDNLPKAVTPVKDHLPRKSTSPSTAERKAVFSQTLHKSRPDGDTFTAIMTSVVRPNLFHCQVFKDAQTLVDLQLLQDAMKLECEQEPESKLQFEKGELCCAKFPEDGMWYRATVLEVFPDDTAKVEYVDYGNQADLPTSLLRPVTEDHTQLHLQAFRCCLHGVSPVVSSWSDTAKAELSQFQNQPLAAKVMKVTDDEYELELTTQEGVSVAAQLISAGVAQLPKSQEQSEGADLSEMEVMRRQNEVLQKQLEMMQSQMAEFLKKK